MDQPVASQLVTLRIDGREVKVPRGTLLVQAAKTAGVEVPVFCYHEKLRPAGACRMCLVEIERMPKLQTACTTPVAEGMVVHTNSPKVIAAQRSVIEFLLINHPLDCPVCDKGGECPLQDNTLKWGNGVSRYEDAKRDFVKPTDLSPEIKLDRERCIMCLRCVRFEREIAGDEALVVLSRGSASEIGAAPGRTFDSPFSGNTIEICPVGALTSTRFRFRARIWDLKQTPTVCDKCPVGCNLKLQVRPNRNLLLRLWSRENPAVDDGWLCDRGRFDYEYVNSPERLQCPLVRRDGALAPATWDEALGLVAERLAAVRGRGGAVGVLGSARGSNEEAYLLQRLARAVLGSNDVDHTWQPHPPTPPLPYDAATGSIAGLEAAGAILVVGADPLREQPVLDLRIKKAVGLSGAVARPARLLVVGPDATDLAKLGTWLRVEPAGLAAVVNAVCHTLLAEGRFDAGFVEARTAGLAELRAALAPYAPELVGARSGVPAGAIRSLAHALAGAGPAAIFYRRELLGGGGAAAASRELVAALYNLALLTDAGAAAPAGSLWRAGAGLYPLAREANAQGCLDVGLAPDLLPGQRRVGDGAARAELEALWGARLAGRPGRSGAEMVRGAVEALLVVGHDPAAGGDPAIRAALASREILVVQDVFLTETARLAHVVLPGTTWAERDGTMTNLERRVQRLRPGVVSPGEARPEWRVVCDLANRLGGGFDFGSPQEVLAELALAAPIYRGLTYARIGEQGIQWPAQAGRGTADLYAEADPAQRLAFAPLAVRVGG